MCIRDREEGVSPVEVKEIVYQSVDYIGMGRMWDFLKVTNEIFLERGIALPLAGQATTTLQDRLEKGVDTQAKIFGEHMNCLLYTSGTKAAGNGCCTEKDGGLSPPL